jgi:acetylornithine/succinyldiaminopimelate/putrescine aminotransferase
LLINAAGRNTLRFVPPLIISADEVRDAATRLRRTITAVLA